MRLTIPQSFRLKHVMLFVIALGVVELVQGTDPVFAGLVGLYTLLFAIGYNIAGGIYYPSGAFIFFTGLLSAFIGLIYKAFLNEPADSVLLQPRITMGAYCLGMAMLGVAAYLTKVLRPRRGLLQGMAVGESMKAAAIGCMVLGIGLEFFSFLLPGAVFTAIQQINRFSEMAILLAVYYEVQRSGGRRSTNWIVWFTGALLFSLGLISFSKEGMFAPLFAWLLPCALLGYQFSRRLLLAMAVAGFCIFYVLIPFAQVGRNYHTANETVEQNIATAWDILSHPVTTRATNEAYIELSKITGGPQFYSEPQGFMDRLEMLAFDDSLIDSTESNGAIGISPTLLTYANLVPRYFYPDKPTLAYGNQYGRELGVIGIEDESTGISFSPTADSFHQARWWGVGLILPSVAFLLFFVTDSLTGDSRLAPWALLPIAMFAHVAPEALIGGSIYMTVYGALMLMIVSSLARWVMPVVGKLLFGQERTRVRRTMSFQPRAGLTVRNIDPRLAGPKP